MPASSALFPLESITQRIFAIRGQRVMLDEDLALLYGVENRALIQAVKRNLDRFPEDFIFQLSCLEWKNLKSQIVISSLKPQNESPKSWGGRRSAPYAFTEHGTLMLSGILNSPRAKEISVLIIRAFVWLRQTIPAYQELAAKMTELENTVGKHDESINLILETLRQLILPPNQEKRRIGF